MYRYKDLKALDVFDKKGKKLGEIEDIAINYYEGKVLGFMIPKKFFSRKNFFSIDDIIVFEDSIVVEKISAYNGLKFSDIRGYEVISKLNKSFGNVEELLIDRDFKIVAMIISKGFFDKFINGKRIILIQQSILGKKNILYLEGEVISFKSLPHSLWRQKNA